MKRTFHWKDSNYDHDAWIPKPHTCPHCGRSEAPEVMLDEPITFTNHAEYSDAKMIELYRCTYADCLKYFIEVYQVESSDTNGYYFQTIKYDYSGKHTDISIPVGLDKISPQFVEVYRQATVAEDAGLDQLAGMGYRKALEFLIKDFAIHEEPDKQAEIKAQFLGKVISDRLNEFKKLQSLATAANWIGTDQTHYEQRYTDKDINDMKRYILSASNLISGDYLADDAADFVEKNHK